jgi:predicted ATPase/DNA-binding winged helix-turn-helix (wHTH) protein
LANQPQAAGAVFLFGPFRLFPAEKLLLDGDARVHLGTRALELLTALVERHGELVTKQELMARAWPSAVVEETNLKVQIAALRKALGEGPQGRHYLATAVGQGYRFVAPVEYKVLAVDSPSFEEPARVAHNLPAALVHPIGRSETIRALAGQLSHARLVTVTGPGGMGKTTVALAVAREMMEAGQHDVWFVDLSTLSGAGLVFHAVTNAVGLTVHSDDIPSALENYLRFRDRAQLVVLDSCEHVIEAAAAAAEGLVSMTPHMRVLATSREPLRAAGENVYRLEPLDSPAGVPGLTADEALQYPAIQLFTERAAASRHGFMLSDDDASVVGEICRRLDGIALAIELAATRLDAFSVRELLGLLDDRFRALGQGRRTAPERHRTLLAMLDWSHHLLPDDERIVLRRLGIFVGGFPLTSATAVAEDGAIPATRVVEAVASLVTKSMVTADVNGESVRYRLLDTTRDYARLKLAEAGELDTMRRRHANHFRDIYERAEDHWNAVPDAAWVELHVRAINDVRAALDWALSAQGDVSLGVALTVSAIPAWLHLSSLEECRNRVKHAISAIDAGSPALDRHRMKLHAALAASAMYTSGMGPEIDAAWTTALAIAEKLDDKEYQLRALFAACCALVYEGKHRAAEDLLQRYRQVAAEAGSAVAITDGERLTAFAWQQMGKLTGARQYLEGVLNRRVEPHERLQLSRFHVDWRGGCSSILSNVLWLQGFPEQALRIEQEARDDAQASGHALTLGYLLVLASVPIALNVGDMAMAESTLKVLQEHVAKHGLLIYDAMARCLQGALLLEKKDPAGLLVLSGALDKLQSEHIGLRYPMYLGTYAKGLLSFGRHSEARQIIDRALEWSNAHEELWYMAELLRIKGEIEEADNAFDTQGVSERLYLKAIAVAHQQEALSLELRAVTNLTRLKHRLGRADQSEALLLSVYEQFTEGFETADLKAARALLDFIRKAHVQS